MRSATRVASALTNTLEGIVEPVLPVVGRIKAALLAAGGARRAHVGQWADGIRHGALARSRAPDPPPRESDGLGLLGRENPRRARHPRAMRPRDTGRRAVALGRRPAVDSGLWTPQRRFDPSRPSHIFRGQRKGQQNAMPYELKLFSGNAHRPLAEEIAPAAAREGGRCRRRPLLRRRGVRPDQRERARRGCLHHPAHVPAREREPDGAARDAGRLQARVRPPHHRGGPVLRLWPAGQEGAVARADLRQAGGRPHHHRGSEPGPRDRPARRSDPGLLQHPGGPSVRGPRPDRLSRPRKTWRIPSWSRRTRAVSSGRARSPSGSKRDWPSSTSAATVPTSRSSCT